jgi:predicted extracellular nuclease/endonuclease I
VQLLSYEGAFRAGSGPAAGLDSTDIGVSEPGNTPVGQSLQLTGQGTVYQDFAWAGPTPSSYGAPNQQQIFAVEPEPVTACPAPPEDAPVTTISAVQGTTDQSPLVDGQVTVRGNVTASFQADEQLRGFYVQDAAGDANPATSDGIFVQAGSPEVAPGQAVQVTGTVAEQFGQTILGNVQELDVCGDAQTVAATEIELTGESEPDLERREGMLVTFVEPLTVTGNGNLGVFGELVLAAGGRLFNPTNAIDPNEPDNSAVSAAAEANRRRQILLDDGSDQRNPDPLPYLTEGIPPRAGDAVTDLTGILGFGFGSYRIHPAGPVLFGRDNARTAGPADVGGSHKVAAFNVLNYFTTLGERGAETAAELDRQGQKLIAALGAIDADVLGLIELENNGSVAIGDLVGRLNVALGGSTYAALPDPAFVGDDDIKVGIISKPGRVTPVGQALSADPARNPIYGVFSRPPIGQVFETGDQRFAVVVNHFKSKGCGDASGADADQGDGQGCWNALRIEQAEALLAFIEEIQAQSGAQDVLVLGDLNAYGEEDPIDALRGGGLTDLLAEHVPEERRYSYVFAGEAGHLDHALATPTFAEKVAGATIWHINTDETEALDYRDENLSLFRPDPYRSSDHDPVVIGLALGDEVLPTDEHASYYAPAQGLGGQALRAALHGIIRGHTRHSYSTIWQILEEADEDPANPNSVIGFYTGRSIPKADRDRGGNTPDFWNREHLWAKSHGFPGESQHAFTDAHHLRAADKSVNGDRGDLDFEEGGQAHNECTACRFDADSWDPGPSRRGDVARALLYMDLRYDGSDGGTPDLELVDRTTSIGERRFGHLCTLLVWHVEDLVDEAERQRNDVVFRWQGNRNPFVDHPEWVQSVWRDGCN